MRGFPLTVAVLLSWAGLPGCERTGTKLPADRGAVRPGSHAGEAERVGAGITGTRAPADARADGLTAIVEPTTVPLPDANIPRNRGSR